MVAWCENIMPRAFFADRNTEIIGEMDNIMHSEAEDDSSMADSNIELEGLEIEDHPDRFFENMHLKKSIERGIALFNLHPEKVGLLVRYLRNGHSVFGRSALIRPTTVT
jgi:hypothetical protein